MKEISLKRPAEKASKEISAPSPRDNYPSFSIYDKAPAELMKLELGQEMTAKVKLTSKDKHEGPNARMSVGFDVISVTMEDKPAKKVQKSNATEYME